MADGFRLVGQENLFSAHVSRSTNIFLVKNFSSLDYPSPKPPINMRLRQIFLTYQNKLLLKIVLLFQKNTIDRDGLMVLVEEKFFTK